MTDVLDFIDWSCVECLNQNPSHSLNNALNQVGDTCVVLFPLHPLSSTAGTLFDGAIIPISRCKWEPIRVRCLLRDTGKMRTCSWNQTQTSSCSYTSPSTKARLPGHMPWQSDPLLCSNPRHMVASDL